MAQNIVLKVAEKEYSLKAETPEKEQLMRLSAEDVNKALSNFREKNPGKPLDDLLTLVSVAEAASKIRLSSINSKLEKELAQLKEELDGYLAGIENTASSAR